MKTYVVKLTSYTLFGDYFSQDEKIEQLIEYYDKVRNLMFSNTVNRGNRATRGE